MTFLEFLRRRKKRQTPNPAPDDVHDADLEKQPLVIRNTQPTQDVARGIQPEKQKTVKPAPKDAGLQVSVVKQGPVINHLRRPPQVALLTIDTDSVYEVLDARHWTPIYDSFGKWRGTLGLLIKSKSRADGSPRLAVYESYFARDSIVAKVYIKQK